MENYKAKTPVGKCIEDLQFMKDKAKDRVDETVWGMAITICEVHLKEEEMKDEFTNDDLISYKSDRDSLHACVDKVLTMTNDEKIKELIYDTDFHLCMNMK